MEFVQRSPEPEPDDFQQRPSRNPGPPVFVERAPGAGEPAIPQNHREPDGSAEVGRVLARYGVDSGSSVAAPRRKSDNEPQRPTRSTDPWGRY